MHATLILPMLATLAAAPAMVATPGVFVRPGENIVFRLDHGHRYVLTKSKNGSCVYQIAVLGPDEDALAGAQSLRLTGCQDKGRDVVQRRPESQQFR